MKTEMPDIQSIGAGASVLVISSRGLEFEPNLGHLHLHLNVRLLFGPV